MTHRTIPLPKVEIAFSDRGRKQRIEVRLVFDIRPMNSYLHVFPAGMDEAATKNAVFNDPFRDALCRLVSGLVARSLAARHSAGDPAFFDLSRCFTTPRFASAYGEPGENPAFSYELPSGLTQVLSEISNHQVAALYLEASRHAAVAA